MATATSMDYVQKIFIAYLGRGASTEALTSWGNYIDAEQEAGKEALFYSLWSSAEGEALYDGETLENIIIMIFDNAFEKAPAQTGIDAWSNAVITGEVNTVELAGAIVDSADAAGAATFALKNEAADYYRTESDKAGRDFNPVESKAAVDPVDSPNSLVASKAETDSVISGTGNTAALTVGNDTPTMSGGDDVVTGTNLQMGNAGTNIDSIVDASTTDSDTLTITGDAGFTFGTVTNVEAVNVSLAKQLGTTFTIDQNSTVTGGTMNLTTAATVDVLGVTVDGSTTAIVNNTLSNVATTGVTNLTVDLGAHTTALSITGDASLTNLTVDDANDAGVTITMANDGATQEVDLGGEGTGNDAVSLSANNNVTLDTDGAAGADVIEFLTLSGNTNEVTFDMLGTVASTTYTIAGSQDVTLVGDVDLFDAKTVTDSSTGTSTLNLDVKKGGVADLSAVSVDVIGLTVDMAGDTLSTNDSQAYTLSANQGGAIIFDQADGNDGTVTITLDGGTDGAIALGTIETNQYDQVTVNAGDETITAIVIDGDDAVAAANDANFTIVGTNDIVAISGTTGTANLTVSANEVTAAGTLTGAAVEVTATGGVANLDPVQAAAGAILTAAGALTVGNLAGNTTAGAGNDVTLKGTTITATGTIDGDDITIEATNDATAAPSVITGIVTAANDITFNGGNIDLTEDVVAGGDITITAGSVTTATGKDLTAATGSITIAGATEVTVTGAGITSARDGVLITSSNDVDLGAQFAGTVINGGSATGKITVDTLGGTGEMTIVTGSGNDTVDLTVDEIHNVDTGDGVDTIGIDIVAATSSINAGGGDDIITETETVVIYTVNGGAGNDTFTPSATSSATVDGGDDSDTLVLGAADHSAQALSFTNFEKVSSTDATISAAQFANDNTFELVGDNNVGEGLTNEDLTITGAGTTAVTIDASAITTSLGTAGEVRIIGSDKGDTLTGTDIALADNIDAGDGNDTINALGGDDDIAGGDGFDIINGGAGVDTIIGEGDNDVIDGGLGADIINGGAGTDTITGGGGADDFAVQTAATGAIDHITDFTTEDTISFANAATVDDVTATDLSGSASLAAAATAAIAVNARGAIQAVVFEYGSDTYIVIDDNDDAYAAADDALIKVTGITDAEIAALAAADFVA